eukprot:4998446-Prymnesium_polylepis.1
MRRRVAHASLVAALCCADAAAEWAKGGEARLHQPRHAGQNHQRTRAEQEEAQKVDAQRRPPRAVEDGLGALVAHQAAERPHGAVEDGKFGLERTE